MLCLPVHLTFEQDLHICFKSLSNVLFQNSIFIDITHLPSSHLQTYTQWITTLTQNMLWWENVRLRLWREVPFGATLLISVSISFCHIECSHCRRKKWTKAGRSSSTVVFFMQLCSELYIGTQHFPTTAFIVLTYLQNIVQCTQWWACRLQWRILKHNKKNMYLV